jgi:hypothetical protein
LKTFNIFRVKEVRAVQSAAQVTVENIPVVPADVQFVDEAGNPLHVLVNQPPVLGKSVLNLKLTTHVSLPS